jgi:lipoprotein-releasing system ATP-binding protein
MSEKFLLKALGVSKSFYKAGVEIPVLRGIDLEIRAGECIAITGASGVGKSTLLHVLGTLEPPSQGKVLFGASEQNIFKLSEKALSLFRNRALGFVFQFHYLLSEFTALENVMMPALIAGHARKPSENQAKELLAFVGLTHRLTHRPSELSGGEQQRVAVARAVILRPRLLLADELTGNLDSANSANIMDLLFKLNESTGVAVLLATHEKTLVKKMHRVIHMKDGVFVN